MSVDYLTQANQLKSQGDLEAAVLQYRLAIENQPSWEVYKELAETLTQQGKITEAISCYHTAIEIQPQAEFYHQLGQLLLRQGETDKVTDCFLKAIEMKPNWGPPYQRLRHLSLTPEQLEKAITIYQRAAELYPHYHEPYLNLGQAYTKQNKLKVAADFYRKTSYCLNFAFKRDWVKQHWDESHHQTQPNFMIIGAEKSGTSSLYGYITQHPQVLIPAEKEIHFFTYNFEKGLDWYQSHFPPIPETLSNIVTGEASTSYIGCHNNAPQRVQNAYPQVKLIAVLRNPVERAISNYHQLVRLGKEKRTLEEVMTTEMNFLRGVENLDGVQQQYWQTERGNIWNSLYIHFIEKWLNVFPVEQLLILRSEELFEQPQKTMEKVFQFLGLTNYSFSSYPIYNKGETYTQPDAKNIQQMKVFFDPYNQQLEALLGCELNW